jgi:hypothetical protein
MSGNPLHALDELSSRAQRVVKSAERLKVVRGLLEKEILVGQRTVDDLTAKIEVLLKVGELFRALMDKLVLGQVRMVEGVVTKGLQTIFFDQELAFESEIGQRYNRIAIDFCLRQGSDDKMVIRGHPLEAFGGGPASVSSLLFRILTLLRLKRWPFLLLDETLAAVSDEYVDQTGSFLQKLAASANIDILLVTHKQAYLEHAHVAYQGGEDTSEDGSRSLSLKCLLETKC